ncbi:MAG: uroporphyrinogen-III synthase [Burkholderiaceae bacterium]
MKVLITRPVDQGAHWVEKLQRMDIDAVALPLIDIQPAPESVAVVLAWSRISQMRLVVFVSPNAVERFFVSKPAGMHWPLGLNVASTGPGTTRALLGLGVPAQRITEPAADAAQFDSESLWERLSDGDWRGAKVLIVRGEGGRDWLAEKLRMRGAKVTAVAAYRRGAPLFTRPQMALLAQALAEPQTHLWLFSSSEAVAHLAQMLSNVDLARAWAIVTHPRIAARAQEVGFGNVVKTRPTIQAVAECIRLTAGQTI